MSSNLDRAIKLARENPIKPIGRNSISRFAAILWSNNTEVVGFNSYKTHPLQRRFGINDCSIHIHAELDAIIKAARWLAKRDGSHYDSITDLSDFRISVARVLKDGTPAMAKPCSGCMKALLYYGVKDIEWTE